MSKLSRDRTPVVIVKLHVEGPGSFGDCLSDAAHTEDAEPPACYV